MSKREYISNFIKDYKEKFGYIPKWNLSNSKDHLLYNTPYMGDEELISAIDVFLNGKWVTGGENVNKFEKEYAKLVNNKEAVAVNSGSSGDLLMVAAAKEYFGWKDGDEVIISAVGFPTTFSGLIINNLKPIIIDIEFESLNYNLDLIEKKITSKTVAILNSPILGNTADIDRLLEICNKHNLILLEDHADSLGTKWNGKEITEYAFVSSCSLYLAHHISLGGHSGIISSNNKELMEIVKCMSRWGSICVCPSGLSTYKQGVCGQRFHCWIEDEPDLIVDHRYVYKYIGFNTQVAMDLMGAIGLEQIKKFPEIHKKRIINRNRVTELLSKYIPELTFPKILSKCEPSWFATPIICPDYKFKTKLVEFCESKNLQTRNFFAGLISLHTPYAHLAKSNSDFPQAARVLREVFFIGANPNWNDEHFEYLEKVLVNYK